MPSEMETIIVLPPDQKSPDKKRLSLYFVPLMSQRHFDGCSVLNTTQSLSELAPPSLCWPFCFATPEPPKKNPDPRFKFETTRPPAFFFGGKEAHWPP